MKVAFDYRQICQQARTERPYCSSVWIRLKRAASTQVTVCLKWHTYVCMPSYNTFIQPNELVELLQQYDITSDDVMLNVKVVLKLENSYSFPFCVFFQIGTMAISAQTVLQW